MTARRIDLEVQTATREPDGRPFVRLVLGREAVLLEPTEARQVALMIADMAGIAETEAAILRTLQELQIGADPQMFITTLVEERGRVRREAATGVN